MQANPTTQAGRTRDRMSPDARTVSEQRLKDLEMLGASLRRRWWVIAAGMALLLYGRVAGHISASLATVVLVVAGAAALNSVFHVVLHRGWYGRWQIYAVAFFDIALVTALVSFYGPGGLIVGFYLAVLPYTFDQDRGIGNVLVLAASLSYLAAAALHGMAFQNPSRALFDLPSSVYLETAVFVAVAVTLKRIPAALIRRIRSTRAVMAEAQQGHLAVRAPAERSDELGLLEASLNRILEESATTISDVQREAAELAVFAQVLADRVEQVLTSSQAVAGTASDLARGMSEQRDLADSGRTASTAAAEQAEGLRSRAELMESDARELLAAAERGRERVARASETLLSIGHEVRSTATTVQELSGRSERIGDFTQAIAKIARQTHLLALNAAIEAARAEEHGEGFAVVADQVRTLGGEAAQSARDMAELITEVRAGIDALAHAMTAGEERVRDVGVVADEARGALQEIHAGVRAAAELVTATREISRDQAERMATLAQQMSRIAQISARSSVGADGAASAMTAQISAMDDLNRTGRQIGELASRLRATVARFVVHRPEQRPGEDSAHSARS